MFQSTRPRGRTRRNRTVDCKRHCVSIHASSREDATSSCAHRNTPSSFNPRVLAGGRDDSHCVSYDFIQFQSTRPRGRTRLLVTIFRRILALFQSTRPRGRTRLFICHFHFSFFLFQSTRPRGRTRLLILSRVMLLYSFNPRVLAGGRDADINNIMARYQSFNPRVLAGGRDECNHNNQY